MDERQLRNECLNGGPLIDAYYDDMVGNIHTCPDCGMTLTTVECAPSCPHYGDCPDCELHTSGGIAWCPAGQVIEREVIPELGLQPHGKTEDYGQARLDDYAAVGGESNHMEKTEAR